MVDYHQAGGTAEDLAARIAAAPPAYQEVVAALKASLVATTDDTTTAALRDELDVERAAHAETRTALRAALQEVGDLQRQAPAAAMERLARNLVALLADKSTRDM